MRAIAFIQARMGSTRLPGKVLELLAGEPALGRVVERVTRTPGLAGVAVLTSDQPGDAPIRDFATERGVALIAGSEEDVLDRFHQGVLELGADLVVRVTADCPLIDPEVLGDLLRLQADTGADHAAVASGALAAEAGRCRYPDGLDGEVVLASAIEAAWTEARDSYEREHVTPFIWRRPERFRLALLEAPFDLGEERWTVDHADDLLFVRAVYERLADTPDFGWREVLALLEREPALRELNAASRASATPVRDSHTR